MLVPPFQLSLETVIGCSRLLGHRLEDRTPIRDEQDRALARALQGYSTAPLTHPAQQDLFCVAPLDILVADGPKGKEFHILEVNGTGIGGLTNLPAPAVGSVLEGFTRMARRLAAPEALVLVAVSGKESSQSPRHNKLVHEKLLYAEALKRGFEQEGLAPAVTCVPQLLDEPRTLDNGQPAVVVGYIKDFLANLTLESDGQLSLLGRPVTAAVNDRFCLNILQRFGQGVDLGQLATMNRCFLPGADKGAAYALLNEFLERHPGRHRPSRIEFACARHRQALIETVLDWLRQGRRALIKPQGTGLGHGIEFFLDPTEAPESVVARIDRSLQETEEFYGLRGGAFPYTVCAFIDGCTVQQPGHPLHGHKYELRVVVYRDGMALKAFPSIVKVSSQAYDPARPDHLSLINNITTSAQASGGSGTDHMLPLCNRVTLALLGLTAEELAELCLLATRSVGHILDRLTEEPEWFGLPDEPLPCSAGRPQRVLAGLPLAA
ncbi:MAG: hypothetical protein L0Z62_21400 [Gemmataceae bacterium]|nr:hypothetical protein [Gemmataceae bacterium]